MNNVKRNIILINQFIMKKTFNLLLICTLIVLSIYSCKKKEDAPVDLATLPFTQETVSESKTNLATTGTQLVDETQKMSNSAGVEAINSFSNLNISSPSLKSASIFQPLNTIATSGDITAIVNSLSAVTEDPTTLQQTFDQLKGIHTWNNNKWVITASSTVLQFIFPSKKGGLINDAQLTVTYVGVIPKKAISTYTGDLPKSFNITLTVASAKVAEYNVEATYSDDGIPATFSSFIAVTPFKIGVEWTYSTANISAKYYFTDADKTIIEFGENTAGNFNSNYLDGSSIPENVVDNANAYFQVLNIKLAGQLDYKSIVADKKALPLIMTDSMRNWSAADMYNKHALLVLIYADSKQKIAQAEAYAVKTTSTYYFGSTQYKYENWNTELRFIFPDKTKGDIKAYFETGFSDLQKSFDKLVTDLQTKFGN